MSQFTKNILILIKKEFLSFLNTSIGTVFTVFFLLVLNFLFFFGLGDNSFWDMKSASMEQFFLWIPILFTMFIPAITMRLWSEEDKNGTLELLMTLPFTEYEIVIGKFLAAWLFVALTLSSTLITPLTVIILGSPDIGLIVSGYLGSFLLAGCYISIGLVVSSLSRDQISVYIITLFISLIFFLVGYQPLLRFINSPFGEILSYLSLSRHFESFRMGIWDIRDFFYTISFIFLCLILNVFFLRNKKV
jgi:ABC-2 type transport system permease protein